MQNIALTLTYDGSFYHGWQIQNNAHTVCGEVSRAVSEALGENVEITGCSRTDAGVHALNYVCNFKSETSVPPDKIMYAVNTKLHSSVRVMKSEAVPTDFSARFSAKSKTYIYKTYTSKVENPFLINYSYHFPYEINIEKIRNASKYFCGEHDFSAFMSAGGSQKTTVRTVNSLLVRETENGAEFEINANAYLYNMVRIISGTLLYVGCGKLEPSDIPEIILKKDRKNAGITAGPQGLYLSKIYY